MDVQMRFAWAAIGIRPNCRQTRFGGKPRDNHRCNYSFCRPYTLGFPVTALVAIGVASILTWLALLLVARVAHRSVGGGFARDAVTRFMGLIVLSMGVQFALTGL